jgi:tRNA threonylcarbamoyladenosine biosynthesis protein TsaE
MYISTTKDLLKQLRYGIFTDSEPETLGLAEALAAIFPENHVLALEGDLGAGKTTFLKGMARSWGIDQPILSPTYNLYFTYSGPRRNLLHLDAYRLNSDADADDLLIEDFLDPPWCMAIEWPTNAPTLIPEDAWWLSIECTGEFSRRFQMKTI